MVLHKGSMCSGALVFGHYTLKCRFYRSYEGVRDPGRNLQAL